VIKEYIYIQVDVEVEYKWRRNMKTVSMLEFRQNAEKFIRRSQQGERMVMTYRGKPVCRLEPIRDQAPSNDDPFYRLPDFAEAKGSSLTNREMDKVIYGA
jgi:prevent-host-death family protein